MLTERGRIPSFLAETRLNLSPPAYELFVDTVEPQYVSAIALLRRCADGDYRTDERPLRFPQGDHHPAEHEASWA